VAQIRISVKDEFDVLLPRSKTRETERKTEEAKTAEAGMEQRKSSSGRALETKRTEEQREERETSNASGPPER
jgi:hypothetical protein